MLLSKLGLSKGAELSLAPALVHLPAHPLRHAWKGAASSPVKAALSVAERYLHGYSPSRIAKLGGT